MIEKYTKKLKKLLGYDIIITRSVYGNYKNLTLEDLCYVKDTYAGLKIKVFNLENELISSFTLLQMVGCCGICISTEVYVNSEFRNKGVNLLLNNFRIDISKHLGYGLLMCTDISNNLAEVKTLEKNNWKHIHNFKNPRTLNNINISIKEL